MDTDFRIPMTSEQKALIDTLRATSQREGRGVGAPAQSYWTRRSEKWLGRK